MKNYKLSAGLIGVVALGQVASAGDLTVGYLKVISTGEQIRSGYDTGNYWKASTTSSGMTTFDAVGSGAGFSFADGVSISGNVSAANFSGSSSGSNSGDETQSTIKTKLGSASSGVDGYLTGSDWTTFNSKVSSPWGVSGSDIYYTAGKVSVGGSTPDSHAAAFYAKKSLDSFSDGSAAVWNESSYTGGSGSRNYHAVRSIITANPSANVYDLAIVAAENQIIQSGSYNIDSTDLFPLRATRSRLTLGGTGTVKGAAGYNTYLGLEGGSATVTALAHYVATSPYRYNSTGTLGTAYGVYLYSQKDSFITDAYGIYQAGSSDKNFFNGKVGVGTSSPTNKLHVIGGVTFTSGAGGGNQTVVWNPGDASWSFTSDRNTKDRITPVDSQAVLEKVTRIPINEWSYIGYEQRHMGPMAQDFHAQFPLNENDRALNDADLHGVALAAIQGLNEKVEGKNLESVGRIQKLESENAELKQALNELKKLVEGMSREKSGGN